MEQRSLMHDNQPQIDPCILAYLAGIVDGEGCIGIYGNYGRWISSRGKRKAIYRLDVKVGMSDPEPIVLLRQVFAGSIHTRKQLPQGGRRPFYTWCVSQRKAKYALSLLIPYLRAKKAQAELALEFTRARADIGHRYGRLPLSVMEHVELAEYADQLKFLKREVKLLN